MDCRLDERRTRDRVGPWPLLALIGVIVACAAGAAHAGLPCNNSYTGADKNGDATDPGNWSAGTLNATSDACIATPGGTVAFTGPLTIHRLTIGDGVSSSVVAFAFGSSSITTTLTVTDAMTIEPGAGFAFGATDTSDPIVTLCVGGTLLIYGTITANGGFSFRPVNSVLKVGDGQLFGTFQTSPDATTQVRGNFRLQAGSVMSGHGGLWSLGCPTTPVPNARRSSAASVQCDDEGTLGVAPGAYQVAVDISGILDLTDSPGSRTVDSYRQDAGGTTKLALSEGSAISEIVATGNAALAGALEVDVSGDTAPRDGDMFTVIAAAAVAGTYSDLTVVGACLGEIYSLIYAPTKVMLTVTGDCATPTASPTQTPIPPTTPTPTPSLTASPTVIPTHTPTPTITQPPSIGVPRTPTDTPILPQTPTSTPLVPPSAGATHTPTNTPTATATGTPTVTPAACAGDCNGNGTVSIDELVTMVNVALGGKPSTACPNGVQKTPVTIDEIISAVNNALSGCRH